MTALPAGGGDSGFGGGSSTGMPGGVTVTAGGDICGVGLLGVPVVVITGAVLWVMVGVFEPSEVLDGLLVGVSGPGYGLCVGVTYGPG